MKKIIYVLSLILISYSNSSEEVQPVACDPMIPMTDSILSAVLKHRDSAFKTSIFSKDPSLEIL